MVVPFFRHRIASMKTFPSWALVGWFIAGATAVLYVALGLFVHSLSIHDRWLPLLTHLRSVIAGMVMGIIITWLIWYFLAYRRAVSDGVDSTSR